MRSLTFLLLAACLTPCLRGAAESDTAFGIIARNCVGCHGEAKVSDLDLRTRENALKGGARGPSLVPGQSGKSLILSAVEHKGGLNMPPGKASLKAEDIQTLRVWIDNGAPWPATESSRPERSTWWSFVKPKRPEVPKTGLPEWDENPVDAFIQTTLRTKGLEAAPLANRETLLRRAAFDLTGLPPTPEDARLFLNDRSPDAWARAIDRYLAMPQYGERWGRYWLDVVRYADTSGFEGDLYFPNAWRYRDYVIRAFNSDKPFDQFIQEQLAADEIWPDDLTLEGSYILPEKKRVDFERRLGTGMYTIGAYDPVSKLNEEQYRYERLTDQADTTAAAFLGLTMGCARCHDHKFDPISQRDYYRLQAVFAGSVDMEVPAVDSMKVKDFLKTGPAQIRIEEQKKEIRRLDDMVRRRVLVKVEASFPEDVRAAGQIKPEQRDEAQKKLAEGFDKAIQEAKSKKLDGEFTAEERERKQKLMLELAQMALSTPSNYPTATVLGHAEVIPDVYIARRGDFHNRGDMVTAGFPSALGDGAEIPEQPGSVPRRRRALAIWLTQPDHPLTSRVMVNRIWQGHFGKGLVATPNDFGRQGDAPTHPELLDWLATEFVAKGWSVKAMHRTIMLSRTYRLSDQFNQVNARIDPNNQYLWRMNRRRLDAESTRDAILSAAGTLNTAMGGSPVIPPLSAEELSSLEDAAQWPQTHDSAERNRRSVYLFNKRTFRIPMMETFDMPDSTLSCGRRDATNVAPQALALLNNEFVFEQAGRFAERLYRSGKTPENWISEGWRLSLGRTPSDRERERALLMVGAPVAASEDGKPPRALLRFCLMLFNLNEFLYVD